MKTIQLVTLLLLLALPLQAQESAEQQAPVTARITGMLVGADGLPMQLAHVSLYNRRAIQTVEVAPDGSYVLETDTTGVYSLWFTGVDHLLQQRTVLLRGSDEDIEIDARLETHTYKEDLSEATVIGDFNEFSWTIGARAMELQPDGTYVVEIEVDADTLAYQVINVVQGRSINGTQSDRYVYDGGGDYRSVIDVAGGVARILFDPQKLLVVEAEPFVRFRDLERIEARYTDFRQQMVGRRGEYLEQRKLLKDEGATDEELSAFSENYDWSANDSALASLLAEAEDADLRATLLATYLAETVRADSMYARMALAEIDPSSSAWTLGFDIVHKAVSASGRAEAYEDFLYAVLRENPDEGLRARLLLGLLGDAHREEDESEARIFYTWLVTEYPESFEARYAKAEFAPDRAIQEGKPVPEFEIASLEDSTVAYSSENMKGQTYLIDFWATWCGPCIGEMPYLHAAYDKYKQDGFTILSLSFDSSREAVIKYRDEGKWKMPWLHGFIEGGFGSEMSKSFQVIGIPRPILIGEDGTILTTHGLRGETLEETLAGVFGRAPPPTQEQNR